MIRCLKCGGELKFLAFPNPNVLLKCEKCGAIYKIKVGIKWR